VIAAPVISIYSDVSIESVGSSFPRVILIGSIFVEVPVVPEVGAVTVASPAGVLELDAHSSSEANPLESSLPPVSVASMVSPFLCLDDSESVTEMPERHVSPTTHDVMLTRWRSRVASRSSSPTTSTLEIPTAPIVPAPSAVVAPSSEFPLAPGIDRKEVGHSSSDHSSSGHSISGHSLPGHASPDTTVADSSTPPRFVYLPLARTSRCSEASRCWRSVPLSTMYPPTTSESSVGNSSSESSAGPSRKRCRSPAATVTSSIYVLFHQMIVLMRTLMSMCIGMEVNVRIDVEDEVEDEVESSDRGTMEIRVDVVTGIDIPDGMLMLDAVECLEQVEDCLQDIYEHVIEIPL
ncbi:hypothetical protein Tco_1461729, partial [Tanacetum coccineum]